MVGGPGLMGFRGDPGSACAADDPSEIGPIQTWSIDLEVAAVANHEPQSP